MKTRKIPVSDFNIDITLTQYEARILYSLLGVMSNNTRLPPKVLDFIQNMEANLAAEDITYIVLNNVK